MNGQCKAFTYNANPKIRKGPNCFLKSSAGELTAEALPSQGVF
ncbi:hypothetical protein [Rhizobium nepotum]